MRLPGCAERHPDLLFMMAGIALLLLIDGYAEIYSWRKTVKQIKVSEAIGG